MLLCAAWHSASLRLPAQVKAKRTLIFLVGGSVGKQRRPWLMVGVGGWGSRDSITQLSSKAAGMVAAAGYIQNQVNAAR